MPILLMLMYIMVQSAQTMVYFEKRTVESRNAAYAIEFYNGGETTVLDDLRKTADETVQDAEQEIAQLITTLGSYGINVGDHVDAGDLEIIRKFPIQRYATVAGDSKWFYESMLETTLDDMDATYANDDPDIMSAPIRDLYSVLDNDHSKSGLTVGVSVSAFYGALGVFHPFDGQIFMRHYHVADFATSLSLHDRYVNKEEVIADGYLLKAGYSEKMKEMLRPEIIFNDLFASTDPEPLSTPSVIDFPFPTPVDPTVGIVPTNDNYDYSECSGMYGDTEQIIPQCKPEGPNSAGQWLNADGTQGEPGDSFWTPFPGTSRYDALDGHNPRAIEYRNGYPVFEPFAIDVGGQPAVISVSGLNGENGNDFDLSDAEINRRLGNPDPPWEQPPNTTWHHHEDCQTMVLIPRDVHQYLRHNGGASSLRNGTCP